VAEVPTVIDDGLTAVVTVGVAFVTVNAKAVAVDVAWFVSPP
jgi:hypothetical protein